jgi:hypothetical protein
MKTWGSGGTDPRFLDLCSSWEVSGQLHSPSAVPLGKEPLVPIGYEAGWTPELVWMTWRSENSFPCWDLNSDPLVNQPVASTIMTALSWLLAFMVAE